MKSKTETDNRATDPEVDPNEMIEASEELRSPHLPPEVVPGTEELTTWDESPDSDGREVPRTQLEDEVPPVEQFIEGGIEEADREQRLAAADPDLETE